MKAPEGLKGLARWTALPASQGSGVGMVLALLQAWRTDAVPEGAWGLLLGLVAMALVGSLWLFHAFAWRALRTLSALGEGRLPPTPEHLRAALLEARAFPERCFAFILQNWVGGALLMAILFVPLAGASWTLGLRIVLAGVSLGPLSALLIYLLVARRARRAVEMIASQGLTPLDVVAAAPPRRMHIRRRMVLFTAIAVLCPSIFILDASVSRTLRVVDQVVAASPGLQEGVAEQAHDGGGLEVAGLITLLVMLTAYLGGTVIAEPLRSITEDATLIAQGDLRPPRVIAAEDEVWATSAAFAQMQAQLGQALMQLRRAGLQISTTTEQLVATSGEQESGADEQASSLNVTSATTEELARSAQQIAGNAESVSAIAETTFTAAQTGQRGAAAFLGAMQRMKEDNQAIADAVVRLNKRVQQIGKVVEFINEIADKSDLLALNAELEGTKAGEVGRGFSLVAAEMRRLAENVIRSTKAIEQLIEEIRDSTHAAVMATEAGLKTTEAGTVLAAQVDESLSLILELARQTSHAVRSISLATQQQQTGTDQLAAAMGDILRVTEQNSAATKQMAAANADLASLARDLKRVVERFHVGAGDEA
ncbi:methyl-accepting chemotaxis protein [Myxococcus sp. RHSTA-1-4]|uniref:methyl-accepting chemotaxis protein n=1 Tax=Myxococcus sp. RHSTA-1-4 TaxID=2874601 RepID=UPI001CBC56F5|nr:methyl-accepting chemotaxis protein [Myxococcus sp. RHSTA-1-4]MBZ4418901.1 methyl-accepting chemotaxis protein [Myxococcus sp. RHSTA-1-4]